MRNLYGLLALVTGVAGIYGLVNGYRLESVLLLAVMGIGIYKGQRPQKADHKLDTSQLAKAQADLALADWEKAREDYARVEAVRVKIRDSQLSHQLGLMQQEAARLLDYVEKHPDRIGAAGRFIHYYQDRAASLSEQYRELEDTQLETDQVRQIKGRLKETIVSFDDAYRAEFTKIINTQLLDMDAELTVMQQALEAEGIHNEHEETALPGAESPVKLQANRCPPTTGIGRKKCRRRGAVTKVGRQEMGALQEKITTPDNLRTAVLTQKAIMSGLAIFLGALGAHKFYQGKTKWGIAYLVLFWTLIPTVVSIVEGIRYFFMPVDDFYEQYYR
ncbi:MAG: 5-bromo-4-chloroindolyl phosphate hydrolysis family protein [Selenomonas sp.]|uniref:5-bromo-4-chloroindolyl phosphate hydrolysis family protein n=1 Tax=Selenomonas sp. TaxID=2053611 RepID=UPI0025F634E5|nr:5-bromo-4-chloroindolyl phosphate hydrolysis family protein [Selenomonas sp.]MCR5757349.1 5-bromo-4-chloroindolyl phosphate hydrolysis family protein [Selenomonas sp.]